MKTFLCILGGAVGGVALVAVLNRVGMGRKVLGS